MADASQTVEDLETKLDEAEAKGVELEKRLTDTQAAHQAQAVELAQLRERLALTEQSAKTVAKEHAAEVQRLNDGIETERNRHHVALADLTGTRDELATVKARAEAADQSHQEHRKQAAAEAHRVAERMTKAEADRDTARKEASSAREDAAKLRGQVEALADPGQRPYARPSRASARRRRGRSSIGTDGQPIRLKLCALSAYNEHIKRA